MKKFFKYNVGAAAGALVLIVILSVFLGVNRTVASRKSAVSSRFDKTVAADLRSFVEYGTRFASAASSLGCDVNGLQGALSALDNSSPFNGSGEAVVPAASKAASVYGELSSKKDADDALLRSAKSYYYEMESTVMRLKENKSYNSAAARYNRAVSAFPANVITGGGKPAAVFDK